MKIYFPYTSARIAQLHALGFVPHPDHHLVPLVCLKKNEKVSERGEEGESKWHRLVPIEDLDKLGQNSPRLLWLQLEQQRSAQPQLQVA